MTLTQCSVVTSPLGQFRGAGRGSNQRGVDTITLSYVLSTTSHQHTFYTFSVEMLYFLDN